MSDVEILKMTNDISNMESGFYCMEAGGLDDEGGYGGGNLIVVPYPE